MKDELEKAIKSLVKKSRDSSDGTEAMKFTQAALNLSHVGQILDYIVFGDEK